MKGRLGLDLSKGMKTIEAVGEPVLKDKDLDDDRWKSEIKIGYKRSDCWFNSQNSLLIETFYVSCY